MGEFDFLTNDNEEVKEVERKDEIKKKIVEDSLENHFKQSEPASVKNDNTFSINTSINKNSGININSESDLDKFLALERIKNKYDPRPDVKQDHNIWVSLLKTAAYQQPDKNKTCYNLLHSIRCAGCKVKFDGERIKLDLEKSPGLIELFSSEAAIKKELLSPHIKDIGYVFAELNKSVKKIIGLSGAMTVDLIYLNNNLNL